ncbi:MAG TPA: isochorismatase family cysteine hydrolase [Candidatus Acidoferrum sp.]|nr:isochorismatase family cysteine hydrolase [Candidatus Acidoferrum sp.]
MKPILWEVDAQADFMLPRGKLYVAGAEKIMPNIKRLVDHARQGRVLLVSSADAHQPDDPEFQHWPPHCVKGTPGAELIPEACAARQLVTPNQRDFSFPNDLGTYRQILLEKNTLDVFDNPSTDKLLTQLSLSKEPYGKCSFHFFVFGVVTEYCVFRTADGLLRRGHAVSIVEDAIQSLDAAKGREILDKLQSQGAGLVTTERALALITSDALHSGEENLHKAAGN